MSEPTNPIENRVAALEQKIMPPMQPPPYEERGSPDLPRSLAARDLDALAQDLIRQGIDLERVKAASKVSGLDVVPDTRSAEERAFDEVFAAPENSADYKFEYYNRTNGIDDPEVLATFDLTARTFLTDTGFPVEIGQSTIEISLDVAHALNGMSEDARTAWKNDQVLRLDAFAAKHGTDAKQVRSAVDTLLASASSKEIPDVLRKTGAIDSVELLSLFYLQAARLGARDELRKSRGN